MRRTIVLIIMISLICLLLAGCKKNNDISKQEEIIPDNSDMNQDAASDTIDDYEIVEREVDLPEDSTTVDQTESTLSNETEEKVPVNHNPPKETAPWIVGAGGENELDERG